MDARFVNVQGRLLKLSHLEKVFYPAVGFRKKDVLEYYRKIAPVVLPHLRDRPFTLKRFPNGVTEPAFFEKQCPHYRQPWMRTGLFRSTRYCLINDLASLLWVVNLAAIELHTTLGTIDRMTHPTLAVLDLDPGEGVDLHACVEVALLARKLLEAAGLQSFPKTSGMKGLHLMIPFGTGEVTFAQTQAFTGALARCLEERHPGLVTAKMPKKHRGQKVYIDWHQNVDFKTTTTVYSLRANDRPTVSAPLRWEEVVEMSKNSAHPFHSGLETGEVLSRAGRYGDLYEPVLTVQQRLPAPEVLQGVFDRVYRGVRRTAA